MRRRCPQTAATRRRRVPHDLERRTSHIVCCCHTGTYRQPAPALPAPRQFSVLTNGPFWIMILGTETEDVGRPLQCFPLPRADTVSDGKSQEGRFGLGMVALAPPYPALEVQERDVRPDKLKALRKVAETALQETTCYRCRSEFGPLRVLLRTSEADLYRFWHENWLHASREESQEGTTAEVVVARRADSASLSAYQCRRCGQVVFLGRSTYRMCRDWALGLAADLTVRERCIGLQAASLALDGVGLLVLADEAARLTAFAWAAALDAGAQVQNMTWTWLSAENGAPVAAHRAERAFLVPTACVRYEPRAWDALATSPCENVVVRRDACPNQACLEQVGAGQDRCVFDTGRAQCFWAHQDSVALVDEALLPGCVSPEQSLRVDRALLLLGGEPEQRAASLEGQEGQRAARAVRGGLGPQSAPWCTPQLFEPVEEIYRKVVERCMEQAVAATLRLPPGQMQRAAELAAAWCSK